MKPRYPLRLFLDCSTAHLSPASRALLDVRAASGQDIIGETPYGWFLWVDENPRAADPDDLGRVMTHARQLGAEYVLFDRDAPPSDALPVFDD